jgi:hypothetical protein
MNKKAWIVMLAVVLFVFVSWPCLAEEEKREGKPAPAKPAPQPAKQQPQMKQPQERPNAPAKPAPQPEKQQPQMRQPQERPNAPQQKQGIQPGSPGQAGPAARPGAPVTAHRPEQLHQVDRGELARKMKAPVPREAQQKAVAHYRAERVRFTRQSSPMRFVPAHRVILKRMRIIPGTYYYRRGIFYDAYGYVPPPYIYTMYPRYGLWDAVFLGFMLERAAEQEYALMYYNHRDEAEMMQWRQDMDRMAMDNADLRARLAAMDQQVAQLQGTPVDSAYVPQDAQDVALSPDVIDQLTAAK